MRQSTKYAASEESSAPKPVICRQQCIEDVQALCNAIAQCKESLHYSYIGR
jgi:hypothetical protein